MGRSRTEVFITMKSSLALLLVLGVAICNSSVLRQPQCPPQEEFCDECPKTTGEDEEAEKLEKECPTNEVIEKSSRSLTNLMLKGMLDPESKEICANLTVKKCTKPGTEDWDQVGDTCIHFFNIHTTFHCAEHYCRRRSGHLLSIHNSGTNCYLNRAVRCANLHIAFSWIGLRRWGCGYRWTDGSCLNYQNWYNGRPYPCRGHCVAMYHTAGGKWLNVHCGSRIPFACSR
ncbi:snaclec coagulation factor IX/factor X-binding protein subunit A-like [Protopterus annectens]|uniref:snaclec coagulation factor IX/factor X-binding protein subunit A-like n=1 Tax=Protopterus annectens TaxID=7888 RepID=UPI001CFAAF89|nr:snaclec coagulation factor IX/factor X-binding protein subunit A-like [Protopterus annectens]